MQDKLRDLFHESLSEFLTAEADNIKHGTSERNLCGRLACILERRAHLAGLHNYRADVEYNRKQDGRLKTINEHLNGKYVEVNITCDIILHSRGTEIHHDNLIAIEMKRASHRRSEKNKDQIRLITLTKESFDDVWSNDGTVHPEHVCGYKLGYLLQVDDNKARLSLEEYVKGKLSNRADFEF